MVARRAAALSSRNRADHDEWLLTRRDRIGQIRVRGLVGQVLFASKKTQESATLLRFVFADGASQHGILRPERVEPCALGDWPIDIERDFVAHIRQVAEMVRKYDADHSLCAQAGEGARPTPVISAFALPRSAPPADRGQSDSSCRQHQTTR